VAVDVYITSLIILSCAIAPFAFKKWREDAMKEKTPEELASKSRRGMLMMLAFGIILFIYCFIVLHRN
jgi:hypothetical protein